MELSNSTVKTPEAETESAKQLPKRHGPPHLHLHCPIVVTYKECLKNHAAALGGHAVDGCGEFMPSSTSYTSDPASFKCAVCGCHRNFHRREPEEPPMLPAIEFRPHHRNHPLPPQHGSSPENSPSPPPISSSYYPSAPQMLLSLSRGFSTPPMDGSTPVRPNPTSRKRFRTKFTQDQKEKMLEFAEKLGWRMQKKDEILIALFCADIGVDKGVLKVWMHNNKNSSCKTEHIPCPPPQPANGGAFSFTDFPSPPVAGYHQHVDSNESEQNEHERHFQES